MRMKTGNWRSNAVTRAVSGAVGGGKMTMSKAKPVKIGKSGRVDVWWK